MSTKGSWKRPSQISLEEEELRHELAFGDDPKRKRAILRKLKKIEKEKENDSK